MWLSCYIITLQGSGGANIIATEDRLSRVVSLTDGYSGSDLTAVSTWCHLQHCTCREVFFTVIFGGAAQHCTVLFSPLFFSSVWGLNHPHYTHSITLTSTSFTTSSITSHYLFHYFSLPLPLPLRCARKQLWGLFENWDRKHCSRWRQKMSDHSLKR